MDKIIIISNVLILVTSFRAYRLARLTSERVALMIPDIEHIMEDLHRAAK